MEDNIPIVQPETNEASSIGAMGEEKKRFKFPKLSIVLLVVVAVCLVGVTTLRTMDVNRVQFYFLGISSNVAYPLLMFGGLLSFAVAVWRLLTFNWGRKILYGVLVAVPTVYASFYVLALSLIMVGGIHGYYELDSPDGEHTIVAENFAFLQGSSLTFYEKTSFCTMKHLYTFNTESSVEKKAMIENIEWEEDGFKVSYVSLDYANPETQKIEFLK